MNINILIKVITMYIVYTLTIITYRYYMFDVYLILKNRLKINLVWEGEVLGSSTFPRIHSRMKYALLHYIGTLYILIYCLFV